MDREAIELLQEIRDLLSLQLPMMRVLALQALAPRLANVLDERDRRVLDASGSGKSARDIERETGIADTTVLRVWRRLANVGIMRQDPGTEGRFIPIFTLTEIEPFLEESHGQ